MIDWNKFTASFKYLLKRFWFGWAFTGLIIVYSAFSLIHSFNERGKTPTTVKANADVNVPGRTSDLDRKGPLPSASDIDPEYAALIEARNNAQRSVKRRKGESNLSKINTAEQTQIGIQRLELAEIKKLIIDQNARIRLIEQNAARDRQTRSQGSDSRGNVADLYEAIDGVKYASQDYLNAERAKYDELTAEIVSARTVNISVGTSRFSSQGSSGTAESRAAIAQIGVNNPGRSTRLSSIASSNSSISPRNFVGTGLSRSNSGVFYEAIPMTGEQEVAQLDLGLHSAIGGPVQATIISGPYQGTILLAPSFRVQREYIGITFTSFCLPDNRGCGSIEAHAVDLSETITAIKGKRRSFNGIRLLGATGAAFISGLGRAYSQVIEPTTVITEGQVFRSPTSEVTTEAASRAALSETGTSLARLISELTTRQPVTRVKVNKEIGIFFTRPGLVEPNFRIGVNQTEQNGETDNG